LSDRKGRGKKSLPKWRDNVPCSGGSKIKDSRTPEPDRTQTKKKKAELNTNTIREMADEADGQGDRCSSGEGGDMRGGGAAAGGGRGP